MYIRNGLNKIKIHILPSCVKCFVLCANRHKHWFTIKKYCQCCIQIRTCTRKNNKLNIMLLLLHHHTSHKQAKSCIHWGDLEKWGTFMMIQITSKIIAQLESIFHSNFLHYTLLGLKSIEWSHTQYCSLAKFKHSMVIKTLSKVLQWSIKISQKHFHQSNLSQ